MRNHKDVFVISPLVSL